MSIFRRRRASLGRPFSIAICAAVAALPSAASGYDPCDNVVEIEKGERAGPLLWVPYDMIAYALAEKVCGVPAGTIRAKVLGRLEKQGCGPGTPVHSETEETIAKMEASGLALMAANGDPTVRVSPDEAQEWARATLEIFGGCKVFLHGPAAKPR